MRRPASTAALRAGLGEVRGDELAGRVAVGEPVGVEHPGQPGGVAVEEGLGVRLEGPLAVDPRQRRVPVVAGQDLVGALAGLHHLDVPGHLLAEQVERHTVVADHGLAHGRDGGLQRRDEILRGDPDLVVVGVEGLGDQVGVAELVALPSTHRVEADGEGGEPTLPLAGEQGHHQTGVQAAGEQHADRHVGHHPPAYGGGQRLQQRVLPVLLRPAAVLGVAQERRVPVDPLVGGAVGLVDPDGGRGKLADAAQDGARRRHDAVEAQVVGQRHRVDGGVHAAAGQQGGQRAGEAQHAGRLGEVERLDAEPVPGQHQAAGVPLADRHGEHADQVVDEVEPPLGVRLDDDLAVTLGEEAVTLGREFGPQLPVVVDAAVEDGRQAGGGIDDGLPAGGRQVDDPQPSVTESDGTVRPHAAAVGPAVTHRGGHPFHRGDIGARRVSSELPSQSAHGSPCCQRMLRFAC